LLRGCLRHWQENSYKIAKLALRWPRGVIMVGKKGDVKKFESEKTTYIMTYR
jgi:hypothetical protein